LKHHRFTSNPFGKPTPRTQVVGVNADPHGATSAPGGASEEGFAAGDNLRDYFVGAAVVAGIGCPGLLR
jgi:hypothetical protein